MINRLVHERAFEIGTYDLKQRFPQMRRTAFRCRNAERIKLAGLIHIRIDTCKGNQGTPAREAGHVSDLGHELRRGDFTDTVHGENGLVFRKHRGEPDHLIAESGKSYFGVDHLLCSSLNKHFGAFILRQGEDQTGTFNVQVFRFLLAEMVSLPLTPFPVAIHKGFLAHIGNAVRVPEGIEEIHPLLMSDDRCPCRGL